MATLTAAQAQEAIEPTAAEELTGTPALEITEKLTAAQALEQLETTAAEELTDAQAIALADDLAYRELTKEQEDALFADDELGQFRQVQRFDSVSARERDEPDRRRAPR